MSVRKGKAWSVFPTQQRDSTRAVTQVIVRPTDPDTLRYTNDLIAQSAAIVPAFAPDPEVAFYLPADGPQPAPDTGLEWDGGHVWWMQNGAPCRVRKIGTDFWPDAPLC
ncbi:hypothetical protein [Sphingomonas sp. UYP23]